MEGRWLAQWQDHGETGRELMKRDVVAPGRKLARFEAVGELLVRHQSLLRFMGPETNQRESQIVGENRMALRKIR
jgi:hypothetical protein